MTILDRSRIRKWDRFWTILDPKSAKQAKSFLQFYIFRHQIDRSMQIFRKVGLFRFSGLLSPTTLFHFVGGPRNRVRSRNVPTLGPFSEKCRSRNRPKRGSEKGVKKRVENRVQKGVRNRDQKRTSARVRTRADTDQSRASASPERCPVQSRAVMGDAEDGSGTRRLLQNRIRLSMTGQAGCLIQ